MRPAVLRQLGGTPVAAFIQLAEGRSGTAYLACTICTAVAHPSAGVAQAQADPLRLEHVIRDFVRVGDGSDVICVDVALVAECFERAEDADVFVLSGMLAEMMVNAHAGPSLIRSYLDTPASTGPLHPALHQGTKVPSPIMQPKTGVCYSLSLTILCPVLIRRVQPSSRVNVARPIADTVRDIRGGDGNVHYGADEHDLSRSAEDFYTTRDL